MDCPKCESAPLVRASISGPSGSLPRPLPDVPRTCVRCDGLWVRLETVETLVEDGLEEVLASDSARDSASAEPADEHDARTGLCPEGHGLLTRARVTIDEGDGFFLERCATCGGVFFDAGEWHALARRRMLRDLPLFWTEEWRRGARRAEAERSERSWLLETLGDDLVASIDALGDALREHPRRSAALAYLARRSSPDA